MDSFNQNQALLDERRQQLENLLRQSYHETASPYARFRKLWTEALNSVLYRLTAGNEPRITPITTGNTQLWKVYDPFDGSIQHFATEDEVRIWLDQRYYQ